MSQYGAFPYNQLKLPLGDYPAHYFSEGLCSLLDMAFCLRDQKSIFIPLNQVDTLDYEKLLEILINEIISSVTVLLISSVPEQMN